MKKLKKLVAVFAALMLALSCFVACSNDSDDGGSTPSNSANNGNQTGGNNQGGSGNAITAKDLQGMWLFDDDVDSGFYFVGNTVYMVEFDYTNYEYYYNKNDPFVFYVSGDYLAGVDADGYSGQIYFKVINGYTAITIIEDNHGYSEYLTLKKNPTTPSGR